LALRASQAAAMLGIGESQLRQWVMEGKVHRPYRVRKNVVLFDAVTLASDWDRMKEEAETYTSKSSFTSNSSFAEIEEQGANPWDNVLR